MPQAHSFAGDSPMTYRIRAALLLPMTCLLAFAQAAQTHRPSVTQYTVTAVAAGHGGLAPASQVVDAITTATITVTPEPGVVTDTADDATAKSIPLLPGASVGPAGTFAFPASTASTADRHSMSGVDACVGFRVLNTNSGRINCGYALGDDGAVQASAGSTEIMRAAFTRVRTRVRSSCSLSDGCDLS
jgi:hypothetical protein